MRIWIGVHPEELDTQRLVALHNEVHMMFGTIRQAKEQGKSAGALCVGWEDSRGMAALCYLHNLVSGSCFRRLGFKHESDLMIPTSMILEINAGYPEIDELYRGGQTNGLGTPDAWPPKWITPQQRIADLMDLQARWADESKRVEHNRSIVRYGLYFRGKLSGERTDPSTITDDVVQRYLEHRRRYTQERLATRAAELLIPTEEPVDPITARNRRLGFEN